MEAEDKEMTGGAEKEDKRTKFSKLKTLDSFEDIHRKIQLIIQTIIEEEKAAQQLHQLSFQMKKLFKNATTKKSRFTRKKGIRDVEEKDVKKKGRFAVTGNFRTGVKNLEAKVIGLANKSCGCRKGT